MKVHSWGALMTAAMAVSGGAAFAAPAYAPRDLTGIWVGEPSRRGSRAPVPDLDVAYTPEFAAIYQKQKDEIAAGRPDFSDGSGPRCWTGMPAAALVTIRPYEVFESDKQITFLRESGSVRRVQLKRGHADDPGATYMGDSIGHWDGNILVVDTTNIRAETLLDRRMGPHSDATHVVERFSRPAYDTLVDEVTVMDPKAFTKPWKVTRILHRHDDWELKEYVCQENDRDQRAADGSIVIKGLKK